MKALFSILLVSLTTWSFAQDKKTLEDIDLIVTGIKGSELPVERKVSAIDNAGEGAVGMSYLTVMKTEDKLLMYAQEAIMEMKDNEKIRKISSTSVFYFHDNKLIKVEEFLTDDGNKMNVDWYFKNDKLIYSTLTSERDIERADMLLKLSKTFTEETVGK